MQHTSLFIAPFWARNAHVQTLLPTFLRRKTNLEWPKQRLELPDGDFLDLCWTEPPHPQKGRPLVVIFHGLEGSFESPYAKGMLQVIYNRGWLGVLMHFRGCSGEPNRLPRSYHSGEISDARYLLTWLAAEFPDQPMAAIGYSLGGNMMANYLAEYQQEPLLRCASIVSAPLHLAACSRRLEQGFSRIYQNHLLTRMQTNLKRKLQQVPIAQLDEIDIGSLNTFYRFDDLVTAPLHGFNDADHYYQSCSGLSRLKDIALPTLILHAADDPFMDKHVIPRQEQLGPGIEYELSQTGGHVGFVYGSPLRPRYFLEERIPNWLEAYL